MINYLFFLLISCYNFSVLGYTTTIAGGLSSGPGHRDGPAQNATFSPDFELAYVPKICALLVADRGNRMIRQINLKPEDCAREKQSGKCRMASICHLPNLLCYYCHLLYGQDLSIIVLLSFNLLMPQPGCKKVGKMYFILPLYMSRFLDYMCSASSRCASTFLLPLLNLNFTIFNSN